MPSTEQLHIPVYIYVRAGQNALLFVGKWQVTTFGISFSGVCDSNTNAQANILSVSQRWTCGAVNLPRSSVICPYPSDQPKKNSRQPNLEEV